MQSTLLVILDGWGYGPRKEADAIQQARTPYFDKLLTTYPNATLSTSGMDVGLPYGQMGNSEVGHMNIGAGRIVYQNLAKINKAIEDEVFDQNVQLKEAFGLAEQKGCIHFMGLVSDGGVHAHINHLIELIAIASQYNIQNIYIHAFTDGRDTDPKSGLHFISKLEQHIPSHAKIVSIIGRYFAMDRDKRWERIKVAYDTLVKGVGKPFSNASSAIQEQYRHNITDEFIEAHVYDKENTRIKEGDVVLCFNFRTDRGREITEVLTQTEMHDYAMHPLKLHYYTMTQYDAKFKNIQVLFKNEDLTQTLGEVLEANGKSQTRIAETEKYPHVTFFFSGGREEPFPNEVRLLIPSPKVATYDLAPEMSAREIEASIIEHMSTQKPDFICLNFANPDMVGHTGDFKAVIKAIETVDSCLKSVVETAIKYNYAILIIADHGNADVMINADGSPNTAHSTNPVPIVLANSPYPTIKNGVLADVAPTILQIMNIKQPVIMTGKSLI